MIKEIMLMNVYRNIIVLLMSPVFITPSQSLICHNSQDAIGNLTCSFNNVSTGHCIIKSSSTSHDLVFSCDKDHLCEGKQDDAHHHICQEEMTSFYCCNHDLCNTEGHLVNVSDHNFTCTGKSACTWSYCIQTTIENSNGSAKTFLDCFHDQPTKPDSPAEEVLFPSREMRKMLLIDLASTCNNSTITTSSSSSSTTHRPPPLAASRPTSVPSADKKNGFSAGVVIGAILVLATGLMLVGVGVKKCYERHLNRRLEYSYAQLTIDMLDDDDDHLILP